MSTKIVASVLKTNTEADLLRSDSKKKTPFLPQQVKNWKKGSKRGQQQKEKTRRRIRKGGLQPIRIRNEAKEGKYEKKRQVEE